MRLVLTLAVVTFLLLSAVPVLAAGQSRDVISNAINALGLDVLITKYTTDRNYQITIDAIIYAIIFFGLTHSIFKKKFSNAVNIGLGLVLTFAMIGMEIKWKFSIIKLGWYAALIVFAFLAYVLYEFLKRFGVKAFAGALGYIVFYLLIESFAEEFAKQNPFAWSILNLVFIASLFIVIINLFALFSKSKKPKLLDKTTRGVFGSNQELKREVRDLQQAEEIIQFDESLERDIENKLGEEIIDFEQIKNFAKTISSLLQRYEEVLGKVQRDKASGRLSQKEINAFEDFKKRVNKMISQLVNNLELSFRREITNFKSLEKELDALLQSIKKLKPESENIKNVLGNLESEINKFKDEISEILSNVNNLERDFNEALSKMGHRGDIEGVKQRCEVINRYINQLEGLLKKDYKTQVADLKSKLEQVEVEIKQEESKVEAEKKDQ